ncbi:RND transporter [Arsukibacterium ikkense]|uniref:RND transporter n=1 Tax=Arsukibacterium ikkense TaxID=336831 RepID=A0A0M2V8K7_9GAMM|nr:efflux RND transporter periplasmic adaptor subunit [Arsukibacterium ikkense]KKO46946.1 RND transporter [Arsukibacterium ikkense]
MRYAILIIISLIIAGWFWLPVGESNPVRFQLATLDRGDIESVVNTAGTTRAVVTVEVGTEVSGLITELLVDFNDLVSQGQLIARLDDRSFQARVRQSEADVVMANANLAQQQAGLQRANAELARAERAYSRQQQLMRQQLSNQSDLDSALADFDIASAQIALAKAQIQSADAQLLQRLAALEQAQLDLDRTNIRSPVNGIVIDRQVDIGQTVAASLSAPTLFTIAQDLRQMQIEADVDEADIGKLQQGQQVRFQVDAYPQRQFSGEVAQVRKAASNVASVVTYKVIISAPNQQQLLLPGMTANLNVIRGRQTDVLRVPNAALRFRPAGVSQSSRNQADPTAELLAQLQLPADKASKVRQLYADFGRAMQTMRSNSGATDARQQMQQLRQKLNNDIRLILTAEEYQQFSELAAARRQQRQQTEQGTPARVWLLDAKQQPYAVDISIGLANDEYSEVLSGKLSQDDAVIVRAVRAD